MNQGALQPYSPHGQP